MIFIFIIQQKKNKCIRQNKEKWLIIIYFGLQIFKHMQDQFVQYITSKHFDQTFSMKAPTILPALKPSPKKKNKVSNLTPAEEAALKQVFNLVPLGTNPITELGLKWKEKEDYQQLKYVLQDILEYPSADLADLHRDCNRLGNYDILENQQKLSKMIFQQKQPQISCQCCGYILQTSQIPLLTPLQTVGNLGVSTHLYFLTLIVILILLGVLFLVYGIFALVTNIVSYNNTNDSLKQNILTAFNYLSVSLSGKQLSRGPQSDYFYFIQCWLGVIVCLIWMVIFIGVKYYQKYNQKIIDDKTISAADFTIVIEGVPAQMTKNQLQKQLNAYYESLTENEKPKQLDRPFKIAKINKATPFYLTIDQFMNKDLKKTIDQKQKQREKFVSWILERQNSQQFSVPKAQRIIQYNKYRSLQNQIQLRYANAVNKIVEQMRQKSNQSPKTSVYVTFQSNLSKQLICYLNTTKDGFDIRKIIPCCSHTNYFTIQYEGEEYKTKIKEAPEPEDIIWTNIGQSFKQKLRKKVITYTITAILLGGSFTVIYFLSKQQVRLTDDAFLSFVISISVTAINLILQIIIRVLTNIQRQQTQTNFQTGLAVKSIIAQAINSVFIPFIVKYFISNNLYKVDGLAFVIFTSGIVNAFLVPLLSLVNINYIIYKIKYAFYKRLDSKLKITQQQLNSISNMGDFQIGTQYIYPVNLFIFICFYVSLQPLVCAFGIVGMIMMYHINKYVLFTKCKRPFPGNDLVNRAMYRALQAGPFIFSLGNLTWSNLVQNGGPDSALFPNLISIVISGIFMLVPYKGFFSSLIKQQSQQQLLFSQKRIFLTSQYDRLNPMTSKQSLIQYTKFLRQFRQQVVQKAKQDVIDIEQLMLKQKQKGAINISPLLQIFTQVQLDTLLQGKLNKDKQLKTEQQQISIQQHHMIIKQDGIQQLKVKRKKKKVVNPQTLFKEILAQDHVNLNFIQNWFQAPKEGGQNQFIQSLIAVKDRPIMKNDELNFQVDSAGIKQNKLQHKQQKKQETSHTQQIDYKILKSLLGEKQIKQQKKQQNIKAPQIISPQQQSMMQHQQSHIALTQSQRKQHKKQGLLTMIIRKGGTVHPQLGSI